MPHKKKSRTQRKYSRAAHFRAIRSQHFVEAAEDYTELIADLIESRGEARTGEIAKEMGITHVTALRTIKRLQRDGYVKTSPHRPVELTAKGKKLAAYSKQRHQLLIEFLVKIGVPKNAAAVDVEGIEHHVSPRTLKAIQAHMKKL